MKTSLLFNLQERNNCGKKSQPEKQSMLNTAYFSIWRAGLKGTHTTCLPSTAFT